MESILIEYSAFKFNLSMNFVVSHESALRTVDLWFWKLWEEVKGIDSASKPKLKPILNS